MEINLWTFNYKANFIQKLPPIVCLPKLNPAETPFLAPILNLQLALRFGSHTQIIQAAKATAKARPPVPGAAMAAAPGVLEAEAPDPVAAVLSVSEDVVVALLGELVELALRRYC